MDKAVSERVTKRTSAWLDAFQKNYVSCLIAHYAHGNIADAVRMSLQEIHQNATPATANTTANGGDTKSSPAAAASLFVDTKYSPTAETNSTASAASDPINTPTATGGSGPTSAAAAAAAANGPTIAPSTHVLSAMHVVSRRKGFNYDGTEFTLFNIVHTRVAANGSRVSSTAKRYSELHKLHTELSRHCDERKLDASKLLAPFPPKKWSNNMDDAFVRARRQQLDTYVSTAAANPLITRATAWHSAFQSATATVMSPTSSSGGSDDGSSGGGSEEDGDTNLSLFVAAFNETCDTNGVFFAHDPLSYTGATDALVTLGMNIVSRESVLPALDVSSDSERRRVVNAVRADAARLIHTMCVPAWRQCSAVFLKTQKTVADRWRRENEQITQTLFLVVRKLVATAQPKFPALQNLSQLFGGAVATSFSVPVAPAGGANDHLDRKHSPNANTTASGGSSAGAQWRPFQWPAPESAPYISTLVTAIRERKTSAFSDFQKSFRNEFSLRRKLTRRVMSQIRSCAMQLPAKAGYKRAVTVTEPPQPAAATAAPTAAGTSSSASAATVAAAAPVAAPPPAATTTKRTASLATPPPFGTISDVRDALHRLLDSLEGAIDLFYLQTQELLEGIAPFFTIKDTVEGRLVLLVMGAASHDWKSEWRKEMKAADHVLCESLKSVSISMGKRVSYHSANLRWRLRSHPLEVTYPLIEQCRRVPAQILDCLAAFRIDFINRIDAVFQKLQLSEGEFIVTRAASPTVALSPRKGDIVAENSASSLASFVAAGYVGGSGGGNSNKNQFDTTTEVEGEVDVTRPVSSYASSLRRTIVTPQVKSTAAHSQRVAVDIRAAFLDAGVQCFEPFFRRLIRDWLDRVHGVAQRLLASTMRGPARAHVADSLDVAVAGIEAGWVENAQVGLIGAIGLDLSTLSVMVVDQLTLVSAEALLAPFRVELEDYLLAPESEPTHDPEQIAEYESIERVRAETERKEREQKAIDDADWFEES